MDLNLSSDEQQFQDELRAWLATNVPREWEQPARNRWSPLRIPSQMAAQAV